MIDITDEIRLDDNEIHEEFIHSTGPGGQNVNKVATAVQIRFDINNSSSLPNEVRARLIKLAGKRVSDNGILIIKAKRFRSQDRNRKDAVERLIVLIRRAASPQKPRKRTRPSIVSEQRRLEDKRRRSLTKERRKAITAIEEH